MTILRCAVASAAPLLGGCLMEPCGGISASTMLVVETPDVSVGIGQSVRIGAFDTWCAGSRRDNAAASWSLAQPSDTSIVQLDPATGTITGRAPGRARVLVTSSRSSNAVTVTVTVP